MRFNSSSIGFFILLSVSVFFPISISPKVTLSLPTAMTLDIAGDVSISYSESDIKQSLPVISGWGGYQKTKLPFTIISPTFWKGVNLREMLGSIVGDIDYNISIKSPDGYNANLTSQEVIGGIRAFDEENVTLNVIAIPVLAFEENNLTIDTEDGPLRLVFVGENNQSILTISTLWVKQVDTIQIEIMEGITVTISTSTQSSVESSSSITTSKSSSSSTIWMFIPVLIVMILYRQKKRK